MSQAKISTEYDELTNTSAWFTNEIHPITMFKSHINSVESVAFNPKNLSEFVSGSHDSTIKIWDTSRKEPIDTIKEHMYF